MQNADIVAPQNNEELQDNEELQGSEEIQDNGEENMEPALPSVTLHTQGEHEMKCTLEQVEELTCPGLFLNREVNWLEFNAKVLNEALEPRTPLLEQLKFLSIFYNNFDEFFMVRVANVLRNYLRHTPSTAPDRMSPARQLAEIRRCTLRLVTKAQDHWLTKLLRQLRDRGVHLTRYADLARKQQKFLGQFFADEIYPVLTPQAIDPSHPLPVISNLSLNFIVELQDKHGITRYARLKSPSKMSRFVFVPRTKDAKNYTALGFCSTTRDNDIVLLEDLILQHLHTLFPGHKLVAAGMFRITRNTDIKIEEEETDDLLEAVRDLVDQRRFGDVVRLEVSHATPQSLRRFLISHLLIKPFQVYRVKGPLAFSEMIALYDLDRPGLKLEPWHPFVPPVFRAEKKHRLYEQIRQKDILLFHPYDSFLPVQEFIRHSCLDPDVIAIKQTLYRAGNQSPIVDALIEARRLGKQVTAVVELKARFDEERNITWAEEMEKAGVHVVYGMPGMKIHTKLCLVVRRETGGMRRYVHIGSGNYNGSTAKIYTDTGLITSHAGICADVSELFNVMTGYAEKDDYRHLLVSPTGLRRGILRCISDEITRHKAHGDGKILIKCNQLVDKECIQALYIASMAGVDVRLQIRGVCCLRPGIPDISENIEVTSIVGRFLEHTRIYYFHNGGEARVYMGSADLMPRNLDRRIETLVPILDTELRTKIHDEILIPHFEDNTKSYVLQENGSYLRKKPHKNDLRINAQQQMMALRGKLQSKRDNHGTMQTLA